ncbi:hypothetical protein [Botrimarina sp.]|uniref:LamG-like jellyroll fold domain-containing protein n=1 Tax=Botrimarina sp. TaxID=2795802 RepID=UPI0032F09421
MRISTLLAVGLVLVLALDAGAQQLVVAYDFEGEAGSSFAMDKSAFGSPLNALLTPGAEIVADTERGDVLQTSSMGFGAQTLYNEKLELTSSFTLQAWVKIDPSTARAGQDIFEHIVGRPGSGPRIFNHFGLGALGAAQRFNTEFSLFEGFNPVDFGPYDGVDGDGQWHHLLISWNHVTGDFWGFWDGVNGNSTEGNGVFGNSPNPSISDVLVTHEGPPGLIFSIGGNPLTGGERLPDSLIDDVAFWEGFATPEVAQGLFDGTYTIFDAPIIDPAAVDGLPGDFNDDGAVDAADYTVFRDNSGGDTALPNDDGLGTPIGSAHYDLWVANYGQSPAETAAVPEPTGVAILGGIAASVGVARRRHARTV